MRRRVVVQTSSASRDAAGGRLARPGGQVREIRWSARKEGVRGGTMGSPTQDVPHRRRRIPEPRPSERALTKAAGRYVELHSHSAYSFLDGASQPEELASRAAELGYGALALTDHDGVYGSLEFAHAAKF